MVILFLIALFLAWPTAGLSLLAYFILLIFLAWRKAKARMDYADLMRSSRPDAARDPVQARILNRANKEAHETRKHFILIHCKVAATSKGVPRELVEAYLEPAELGDALDYLIAAKAQQGLGAEALTTYVSDWFVEKCLERMRDQEFDDEIPF